MDIDNPNAPCSMNSKAEDYGDTSACRFTWTNDVVLMEILLCLPAKSLTRFMLVCNKWRSIISSDQFRRLHTLRHPKPPELSLLLTTSTSDFFYFHPYLSQLTPYNFSVSNPIIVNSCNGLLLLRSHHDYYVYNPTTKQSRKLKLAHNGKYPRVVGLNLAFDPSKSPHYKIICLRTRKNYGPLSRRVYQIEVYTSERRAWEICVEAFTISSPVFSTLGVHCNNFIYWPSIGSVPFFDIAKNGIKYLSCPKMPRPMHEAYVSWSPHLQELNGHLHYYVEALEGNCETVELWEMQGENDDPRWFLKYCDRISRTPSSSAYSVASPLRIVTRGSGKMRLCRFLDKSCKEVGLRSQSFDQQDVLELECGDVHQFGECLAPV